MPFNPASIASLAWRLAIALLTLQVLREAGLRYLAGTQPAPEPILGNAFASPFLVLHVVGAMIALAMGPLQFLRIVRGRWPALHRASGYAYLGACALGAPTGLVLAFGTTAGPAAGSAFAVSSILWMVFSALGLRAVLRRRLADHRAWMLRSYGVLAGAIMLRLMLPASLAAGYEFYTAYQVIAWLSWPSTLAFAELAVRRGRAIAPASGGPIGHAKQPAR